MKLKYLLSSLLVVFLFLASSTKTFAACDASIANFDAGSRNLQICVGQFDSPTQLRATTATFNCIDNSNALGQGCRGGTLNEFFHGLEPIDYSLSSTPDNQIAQDANGKYYTCFTYTGVNRAVGKANVTFSGGQTCSSPEANVRPSNWDPILEGNIFGQAAQAVISALPSIPANTRVNCVASDGTQGVNTALGCISFDATGGGFVRSLLGIIIGLGGGVALLLILYGVFIITTSAGIPEKLKEGKELITSAIAGLLFIIMAIFLMNLIGIQLLAIPGLQ